MPLMFSYSTSQKLFLAVVLTEVLDAPPPGDCDPLRPRRSMYRRR